MTAAVGEPPGALLKNEQRSREAQSLSPIRARAQLTVSVEWQAGRTLLKSQHETGGLRARFPKPLISGALDAIVLNSNGGVAGGDAMTIDVAALEGSRLQVSSAGAERIYRTLGPKALVDIRLEVGPGAHLSWLPLETILYNGASLERRLEVDVAATGCLLIAEMLVFGRTAFGEVIAHGHLNDQWRIRYAGKLVLAEAVRLDGAVHERLQSPFVAGGQTVVATLVYVAAEAEERLVTVREMLGALTSSGAAPATGAASAWKSVLVARFLGDEPHLLRHQLASIVERLQGRAAPATWGF